MAGLLAKLKHLKTLNIRNVPPMYPCCHNIVHVETLLHGLVDEFVKDLVYFKKSKKMPQLQIIGLGALLYRDIWDGKAVHECSSIEETLRLRIWAIDYVKNALGVRTPLLTQVASGFPGNVGRDISEDMNIFTPYWLG